MKKPSNEQLLEEVERLIQENKRLRDEIGLSTFARPILGLTPTETRLLGMLMKRQRVSRDALLAACCRPNVDHRTIDVMVCKLRQKMRLHGVTIITERSFGYYISQEDREKMSELIRAEEENRNRVFSVFEKRAP